MKKAFIAGYVAFFLTFVLSTQVANACTDFIVTAQDGTIVNGRSMEFAQTMDSLAIVHPRGETVQSTAPNGTKGLSWTTKYGYVVITSMGKAGPNDGMNEAGLSLGFLWYAETKYPVVPAEKNAQAIEILDSASWLLGNFATVDEVKTALNNVVIWGAKNPLLKGVPPLHIALHDARGKNLVVEFADGKMNIYDNPIGVLTNAPTFPWQLTNLRNYANLAAVDTETVKLNNLTLVPTGHGAGMHGIPGDATPPSRFVRTVFNTQLAAPVKDSTGAISLAQHVLNAVDIPMGTDRLTSKTFEGDYTQWAAIKDLTHKIFYFRSYGDLSLKAIDLSKLDFTKGAAMKSISIAGKADKISEVTEQLNSSKN